jgi:hypothetical protein
MYFRGNEMGELHQLMLEHEEQLEEALDAMECGWPTQDQIDIIRHACGKPRSKRSLLEPLFEDFNNIFGGKNATV